LEVELPKEVQLPKIENNSISSSSHFMDKYFQPENYRLKKH